MAHQQETRARRCNLRNVERSSQIPFRESRPVTIPVQQVLFENRYPAIVDHFPKLRFMGSKCRLLPWIHEVVSNLTFDTVLDAFSGSGCVAYLFKAMGKQVITNDFLNLCATIGRALIENSGRIILKDSLGKLLDHDARHKHFIERTFSGIFFTPEDLRFLDQVSWNIKKLKDPFERSIALAALIRSCAKRQPRGVFTVAGDPEHYKDGRRDLRLSLREHFIEQVAVYNNAVFDNGRFNSVRHGDVFKMDISPVDLVYMDPPYVPRSDDNCYMKRYHFLEGLSSYWEGVTILNDSRVKKIVKPFTPFSYRKTAIEAFNQLFHKFSNSILVLSYSSNGFPDLPVLVKLMRQHKGHVEVFEHSHRYHFGTHAAVKRALVQEYLIIGH